MVSIGWTDSRSELFLVQTLVIFTVKSLKNVSRTFSRQKRIFWGGMRIFQEKYIKPTFKWKKKVYIKPINTALI
jgi:hypothetical protein